MTTTFGSACYRGRKLHERQPTSFPETKGRKIIPKEIMVFAALAAGVTAGLVAITIAVKSGDAATSILCFGAMVCIVFLIAKLIKGLLQ
ncbi:hypothetical protein [Novosphingobium sp. TCA1]|uniref:hypothetical protein n=1 Tax=Novosphingobium sp. TCA1 TaxID=2682474 RepID=UPI001055A375|nr:hypothetical protein [Novosphingobium sp. TCA1]